MSLLLLSLALPRLFQVVEGSRAAEAVSTIATIRSAMERCYLMNNGSYTNCKLSFNSNVNTLDISDPSNSPGAHFKYNVYNFHGTDSNTTYAVLARRKDAVDGGNSSCQVGMGFGVKFKAMPYGASMDPADTGDADKIYWTASDPYRGFIPSPDEPGS